MVRCVFFFKQKTAYEMRISDWSSDVCSSDLPAGHGREPAGPLARHADGYSKDAAARVWLDRQYLLGQWARRLSGPGRICRLQTWPDWLESLCGDGAGACGNSRQCRMSRRSRYPDDQRTHVDDRKGVG